MDQGIVNNLARLARIDLGKKESENLARELGSILDYVGEIKEVKQGHDSSIKKPDDFPTRNTMRLDNSPHESGEYTEELLVSAPNREGDYVKVKKIL